MNNRSIVVGYLLLIINQMPLVKNIVITAFVIEKKLEVLGK